MALGVAIDWFGDVSYDYGELGSKIWDLKHRGRYFWYVANHIDTHQRSVEDSFIKALDSLKPDAKFTSAIELVLEEVSQGSSFYESLPKNLSYIDSTSIQILKIIEDNNLKGNNFPISKGLWALGTLLSLNIHSDKYFYNVCHFAAMTNNSYLKEIRNPETGGVHFIDDGGYMNINQIIKFGLEQLRYPKIFKNSIESISRNLDKGKGLYDSFAEHPHIFNDDSLRFIELEEIKANFDLNHINVEDLFYDIYTLNYGNINSGRSIAKDKKLLKSWINKLPFPLAVVLREYISLKTDDSAKYRLLLKFFECSVAYLTTIYFGVIESDNLSFQIILEKLKEDKGIDFTRLTFGHWVKSFSIISKYVRSLVNNNDDLCKKIFSDEELYFPSILSAKKLSKIFDDVVFIRNAEDAHGSYPDKEYAENLNSRLLEMLDLFKKNTGAIWERKILIRVESTESFSENNFIHDYSYLMGSDTKFERKSTKMSHLLFKNNLYLIDNKNSKPIKLAKFMQIEEPPKKMRNACYFYNKLNNQGKPHFISYHYSNTIEGDSSPEFIDLINQIS